MLKDRMGFVNPYLTVQTTYAAVSGMQSEPPAQQVLAAGILFNAICDRLQLDPSQLIDQARRVAKDADDFHHREHKALCDYIDYQIQGKRNHELI